MTTTCVLHSCCVSCDQLKPSKSAWHKEPAPFHLRTYLSLPDAVKLVHSGLLQRARRAADAANGTTAPIADRDFDVVLTKRTADFTANDFQELCQQLQLRQVFAQSKPSSPKGRSVPRDDSADEEDDDEEEDAEPAFFMEIPREVQIVDSEYGRVVFCDVVSVLQPQVRVTCAGSTANNWHFSSACADTKWLSRCSGVAFFVLVFLLADPQRHRLREANVCLSRSRHASVASKRPDQRRGA